MNNSLRKNNLKGRKFLPALKLVCLSFLLLFGQWEIHAQNSCFMENTTFQAGEELTYKLYYNWNFVWLSAGEVTFKIEETPNEEYHIGVVGKTYSSYEWFFKVNDRYDTWIYKKNLLPTVAVRDVQEGKISFYQKIVFNQSEKTATTYYGDNKDRVEKTVSLLNDCAHDLVSVIYYARNINYTDFKEGTEFPVRIFMDKAVYPLRVKYKGKVANKYVHKKGRFRTIHFSPQVLSGNVFKEGTQPEVYVSDDRNRIPILIESAVSVGSVKAVLKSYKGLRYDFTSKID